MKPGAWFFFPKKGGEKMRARRLVGLRALAVGGGVALTTSVAPRQSLLERRDTSMPFDSRRPFEEPAWVAARKERQEREALLLDLRAKARNRLFMLQQRRKRKDISRREYEADLEKLKLELNVQAQQLIYGVPPELADAREDYLKEFGCVKWTDQAMRTIAELSPLVEMGAGNGQWKKELVSKWKADVVAYDSKTMLPLPVDQVGLENDPEAAVLVGNESTLAKHADRTLLLVAPPPTDMAFKCLGQYSGRMLVYVGEGVGGAHADEAFFKKLESDWQVVQVVAVEPFAGCFERCYVMERKPKGWGTVVWGMLGYS